MKVKIIEAVTREELKEFVRFPYMLYRKNRFWVPPLIREQREWIVQRKTTLFRSNPHVFLLAKAEHKVLARIAVSEDLELKRKKNKSLGYFTLVECVDDFDAFKALFVHAEKWAESRGLSGIQGPVSPTKGEDQRGWLVKGFDSRPVFMNTYNPEYYITYAEKIAYTKYKDFFAYHYNSESLKYEKKWEIMELAKKKYGFRIDRVDLKDIKNEAKDMKEVLDRSILITAFENGLKKGIVYAEGSTIGEENEAMRSAAEKIGGRHYKTYRIYEKYFPQ